MTGTWTRETPQGDTITVTVDARGAAVSVQRVSGAREGYALSLEEFEEEWAPWLAAHFDDAIEEIHAAVESARGAADDADDGIP